jgi:hypothetical protein
MSYALGLEKKPWEEWLRHLQKQPMMMMMKICNTRQSNMCGGGMTKTMDCYYYYYYWARGDRAFGDVFSLCWVMIVTSQQIINIFYIISMDGRHSMRTHTTTNQKQRAAIMEDSKERWHYHRGNESQRFGDNSGKWWQYKLSPGGI